MALERSFLTAHPGLLGLLGFVLFAAGAFSNVLYSPLGACGFSRPCHSYDLTWFLTALVALLGVGLIVLSMRNMRKGARVVVPEGEEYT